ncbi:MAG: hypothetical protein ACYCSP_10335 [Acidobacteriaceae bacterium]
MHANSATTIQNSDMRTDGPADYQRLAMEIAVAACWAELADATRRHGEWFDLGSVYPNNVETVIRAVRFLEAGGHLERRVQLPFFVRRKTVERPVAVAR